MISADPSFHESVVREVMLWAGRMNMDETPPLLAQQIHRRLRSLTGVADPYREVKDAANRTALALLPRLSFLVNESIDPLEAAVKFSIAGNLMDLGAKSGFSEDEIKESLACALDEEIAGDYGFFKEAVRAAERILYLADNAGEIVLDRLLIERLPLNKVTLAVRGAPVINDATAEDARVAGLHDMVAVVENGSDAPGTVISDCGDDFLKLYAESDMIIAKGQGNYETLSDENRPIFFLLKVKCGVIAERIGYPVGSVVVKRQDR